MISFGFVPPPLSLPNPLIPANAGTQIVKRHRHWVRHSTPRIDPATSGFPLRSGGTSLPEPSGRLLSTPSVGGASGLRSAQERQQHIAAASQHRRGLVQ